MSGLQLPTKTDSEGTCVVWDVVPRDVSVDADGDMYVIDAGDQLCITRYPHITIRVTIGTIGQSFFAHLGKRRTIPIFSDVGKNQLSFVPIVTLQYFLTLTLQPCF